MQDLDHHVWKLLKANGLQKQKILVALSGGVDSLALLLVLAKIHKGAGKAAGHGSGHKKLAAAYFHHGEGPNQEYRDKALKFCQKVCLKNGVEFFSLKASRTARSEAEHRASRYEALQSLMATEGFSVLSLGHHQDDLLETRLLRLIRGTGAQGLQAMEIFKDNKFRPFLQISKKELKAYLRLEKQRALEDPSNKSSDKKTDPLRNWLRQDWLKALEKRQKGGVESLSRSLETLSQELSGSTQDLLLENEAYRTQGLSRGFYLCLSPQQQKRLLAQYLWSLQMKNFSQSHLEEIQKRLDNPQKVFTLKVAGCLWEINAEQIKVQV